MEVLCKATITVGNLIKSFGKCACANSYPRFKIDQTGFSATNNTADKKMLVDIYMKAEEISLTWAPHLTEDEKSLIFSVSEKEVRKCFDRFGSKDTFQLRIIRQEDDEKEDYRYFMNTSLNSGDRQGITSAEVYPLVPLVFEIAKYETPSTIHIPVGSFKKMLKSIGSKSPVTNHIIYQVNEKEDIDVTDGLIISQSGNTDCETYGDVDLQSQNDPLNIFPYDRTNYSYLYALSSLHNEGFVRISFEEGKALRVSFSFGCFGQANIYILNKTEVPQGYSYSDEE